MKKTTNLTAQLARWSQFLVGIAKTGLAFTNNPYDEERYEELLKLAAEITASINPHVYLDVDLATRLETEWRNQVTKGAGGYTTPKISIGAIVFNDQDEILLVQSAANGEWCFPVGNADIGYTAAEVARKETWEEAGLQVTPLELIGVADSFRQGFNLSIHIYNLQFYCRLDGGNLEPQTAEIKDAGFFGREKLPYPLVIDGKPWVDRAYDWHYKVCCQPYFD